MGTKYSSSAFSSSEEDITRTHPAQKKRTRLKDSRTNGYFDFFFSSFFSSFFFRPLGILLHYFSGASVVSGTPHPAAWDTHISSSQFAQSIELPVSPGLQAGLGIHSNLPKNKKMIYSLKKRAIHSFPHFWWATWAIHSRLLISSEQCEQITHGRSFLVSDLSD